MKTEPIVAAQLAFDTAGTPYSPEYGDVYHPRIGAAAQARHVFLAGNALPQRWRGRERFVVLETGFGLGNNFLATWQAWRDDPQRCRRLSFISIEQHPLTRADLDRVHRESPWPALAAALQRAWPASTPNLHRLVFDDGGVELLLALGDVQAWLVELVASVDAFFLDGFAPAANPRMWEPRVCKALARLAAPGATLATWSAAHALRDGLSSAGFEVRNAAGIGGKRDITLARFAPRFTPRRAPAREPSRAVSRLGAGAACEPHALIIGAGLAGCQLARALAEHGWQGSVFERNARIADEASGNPAGLFHGVVHADDGVYARAHRAAAFAAQAQVQAAIARDGVAGSVAGLLRLEAALDAAQMHARLERLRLPAGYVQALDGEALRRSAGIELASPAWFYPGGGWVDPGQLARSCLEAAAARFAQRRGITVDRLEPCAAGWRALDAEGHVFGEAPVVVLANAGDALRFAPELHWPIAPVRGQISIVPAQQAGFALPRLPVAGAGWLVPPIEGELVFGATAQPGDGDGAVRDADHRANLANLEALLGCRTGIDPALLRGRTAWRWSAADRLPLIGAVPDAAAAATARVDQPRFVPRRAGLYVFTALGSRGIGWSALGAQLLAATIAGAPLPLEASLIDALDPARFVSRAARRGDRA